MSPSLNSPVVTCFAFCASPGVLGISTVQLQITGAVRAINGLVDNTDIGFLLAILLLFEILRNVGGRECDAVAVRRPQRTARALRQVCKGACLTAVHGEQK